MQLYVQCIIPFVFAHVRSIRWHSGFPLQKAACYSFCSRVFLQVVWCLVVLALIAKYRTHIEISGEMLSFFSVVFEACNKMQVAAACLSIF